MIDLTEGQQYINEVMFKTELVRRDSLKKVLILGIPFQISTPAQEWILLGRTKGPKIWWKSRSQNSKKICLATLVTIRRYTKPRLLIKSISPNTRPPKDKVKEIFVSMIQALCVCWFNKIWILLLISGPYHLQMTLTQLIKRQFCE